LRPGNGLKTGLRILRGNNGQESRQAMSWQSKESIAVFEQLLVLSNNIVTLRETVEI
jgi:hypothetical protein